MVLLRTPSWMAATPSPAPSGTTTSTSVSLAETGQAFLVSAPPSKATSASQERPVPSMIRWSPGRAARCTVPASSSTLALVSEPNASVSPSLSVTLSASVRFASFTSTRPSPSSSTSK